MRNFDRDMFGSGPGGFTLVEMLVAVAMGAALVAGAAAVFSLAGEAVGTSQAITELNSQIRIVHSWLDRDFGRIRLDGPLVLLFDDQEKPDTGETMYLDRMYFLISGNIPSIDAADYRAGLAILCYTPDSSTDFQLSEPYDWVLTRRATLIASELPTEGGTDVAQSSFAELVAEPSSPIWEAAITKPDLSDPDDRWAKSTQLLNHVTSFKIVRFCMAGSAPTEVDEAYRAANPFKYFQAGAEKPAWIDFEIVLRDSGNRMKDDFVSTYRVNLPSR